MRGRSNWLFHPKVKATWVAITAGSLAGLAVLGACSDAPVSKVAGPDVKIPGPRFYGAIGANAHVIKVCVDQTSTPGTYYFTTAVVPPPASPAIPNDPNNGRTLELPSVTDPTPVGYTQAFLGPYTPGDDVKGNVSVTLPVGAVTPVCAEVFHRAEYQNHAFNRMMTFPVIGTVNPYGALDVTLGGLPAGSTFTALCTNDDPNLPQTAGCAIPPAWSASATYALNQLVTYNLTQWQSLQAGNLNHTPVAGAFWTPYVFQPINANPIRSSANVFHGSTITYSIITPQSTCPLGSLNGGFNGTAIPSPRTVWFTANLKASGPIVDGTVFTFTGGNIHLTNGGLPSPVDIPTPNGRVTFSASAAISTTTYDLGTNTWQTIVPLGKADNVFLSGVRYPVPLSGLTGGANANWTGAFASTTNNVTAKWQFAAAVYDPFNTDYNALGVKPLSSNTLTIYLNSDKLGTPENYKANLKSGAMGGGGSNFIGSWSETKAVCVE
jgi:hypothetical protein